MYMTFKIIVYNPKSVHVNLKVNMSYLQFLYAIFILHGTRCTAADPDSTDCPTGWARFAESCYHIGVDEKRWSESMSACEDHESRLVNVETEAEHLFLVNYLHNQTYDPDQYWLGGSDWTSQNMWVWEPRGNQMTFSHWYPGRPVKNSAENCLSIFTITKDGYDGNWFDERCDDTLFYICEKGIPSPIIIG